MTLTEAVAIAIFAVTMTLVFSDRVHRIIAGAAGAAAMMIAGYLLDFYTEEQAIEAIDFHTLGLLLGMMILVRLLEETGFFEWAAIVAARKSGGKPWRLVLALGVITTVLSLVLDNVTTVVLIAPLTVLVAELIGLSPIPALIAIALLSNTGGMATLIGDPPNILIGSAANLSFTSFLVYLAPIVLVVWVAAVLLLRRLFRHDLAQTPTNVAALRSLDVAGTITDMAKLRRVLIVLAATVGMFFIHGLLHVSPALVALIGAAAALAWVRPDVNETLQNIHWGVLIFFVLLFVVVGGLEAAGVLALIAESLHDLKDVDPRLVGVLLMWGVAILSAMVDNIPITIAAIPVIMQLETAGMNVSALWWALALGAGLGGNGTIVGSTANIVVVTVSERTRTPITPRLWMRRGLPVMVVTLCIASVLFALLFPWLNQP